MKKSFLLLLVTVFFTGCIFKGPDDLTKKKPDFEMAATDLFNEYEADEDAGNEKFLDKIILVSGEVVEISDKSVIVGDDMTQVNCAIADEHIGDLASVETGQEIRIKGACTGFNMFDIGLTKCVVVE